MRKPPRRRQRNQSDPKQMLIFIGASMIFLSVWQSFMPPPAPVNQAPVVSGELQAPQTVNGTINDLSASSLAGVSQADHLRSNTLSPVRNLQTLEAPLVQNVTINSRGQISKWINLEEQYAQITDNHISPYILADDSPNSPFVPPLLEIDINGQRHLADYQVKSAKEGAVTLNSKDSQLYVERRFEVDANLYAVNMTITVKNISNVPAQVELIGITRGAQSLSDGGGSMFSPPLNLLESLCATSDGLERDPLTSITSKREDSDPLSFDNVKWFGVDNRYFMSAMSSESRVRCVQSERIVDARLEVALTPDYAPISTRGIFYRNSLLPNAEYSHTVNFYMGPKRLEILNQHRPSLDEAIDFGIFSPICVPMLYAMRAFFSFINNWGIAIILLTLLVKLFTMPLTIKQYQSMAKMKALQPEMNEIKEKYQKSDPARFQQETMALYKKHGANPISGCLPMVVMMPIYFALYRTIFSAVELYQAPFFGWLADLSKPDPYFITPIILGGLMLIQARLQPNPSMDPVQRKMMTVFMPGFFSLMMLFLPSGLVLYILVNTVLGLFQQRYTIRKQEVAAV